MFQMMYYNHRWQDISAPMKLKDVFEGLDV